jgi:S-adenosylmethionine:tRNA ribosyltransferase-isomerase
LSGLNLTDYEYGLDAARIAQRPTERRDQSRLMVVDRRTDELQHNRFHEITEALVPGDLLVLNDTRVVPARLQAKKKTGGLVEIFLLRDCGAGLWDVLIRGKVAVGTVLLLDGGVQGVVEAADPDGARSVRFSLQSGMAAYAERYGSTPVPPYIRRNGDGALTRLDRERYQTVYAKVPGAVAAPTAGLHFTEDLLRRLAARGVASVFVTLHVGYGTFRPVTEVEIRRHRMDRESYTIGDDAAERINAARRSGRRVIAVGTTTTRALESAANADGEVAAGTDSTELFVYPGYRFRVIEGLLTNFHLPRSTLLMLVAAFAGKERMDRAYREAVARAYRFYSYGDAMLIL